MEEALNQSSSNGIAIGILSIESMRLFYLTAIASIFGRTWERDAWREKEPADPAAGQLLFVLMRFGLAHKRGKVLKPPT